MRLTRRGLLGTAAVATAAAPRLGETQTAPGSTVGAPTDHADPFEFSVQVGIPRISIHQGQTVLVTQPDGQISAPSDGGLYFLDTRVISSWSLSTNGQPWALLNGGASAYFAARIFLTNPALQTVDGTIPARTLGLTLTRHLTDGLAEDIAVSNNTMKPVRFEIAIDIKGDFADIFEVKSNQFSHRGEVVTTWSAADQTLRLDYRYQDFHRAVIITSRLPGARSSGAEGRLIVPIALEPGAIWRGTLLYDLLDNGTLHRAPREDIAHDDPSEHARFMANWSRTVLKVRTSNSAFYRCFTQGVESMAALRLPVAGTDDLAFVPAAGLPWFIALFGRDSLIASMQTAIVYPEFGRATLTVLGEYQAKERDDYRDAEPGKILHELRSGELAHFKLVPHTPYYGTSDATPLYLIALHTTWRVTGDTALLRKHLATAEGCLSWIDQYGDRDGDGFQEYQTRSTLGYENTGWKDSGNSVVYEDGTLVRGPKALCELQGYVYDAWRRMAEIYKALGNPQRAADLNRKADILYRKFNETFWNESIGFYAYTLDGDKRPVFSVASNAGHLLWSGIVPPDRAARVVARLTQPDMWSGWGIRTLSASHPAFNPYDYQVGSVWPHDNAIIAAGFRRYGFNKESSDIASCIVDASRHFLIGQLPELYAGLPRGPDSFPVQYVGANVPQAWAAGTPFLLLQSMLGLTPDAPNGKMYVDPDLPAWLPDITLLDLRLGKHSFDISFWREGTKTRFKVLRGDPHLVERQPLIPVRVP